jgi:plasmid maintenance system antidote protein VapI
MTETELDLDYYTNSHPGEALGDLMIERVLTIEEVHQRTGIPPRAIRKLLRKKMPVGRREADALEAAFGVPAQLWLNLQSGYDKGRRAELVRNQVACVDLDHVWRLAIVLAVSGVAGLAVLAVASKVMP